MERRRSPTAPSFRRSLLRLLRRLGVARGISARHTRAAQPAALLELYGFEGCPACRRVRRALTELDLDFIHRSCPVGDAVNREAVTQRGGRARFPYLVDPNTRVEMYDSREIVAYLEATYGLGIPEAELAAGPRARCQ